jgi:2-dehydropantoate 2-reductase
MAMKILVIGAGAVGGYFGGRLAQAGRDVTFLVHLKQADAIRKDGLQILSPHGNATLHPGIVLADELTTPYDLIFLSVKAYGLEKSMDDFAPAVGKNTMIFPVLNGLRHIDLLTAKFGREAVIGGVCLVVAETDKTGRIVQLTDIQKLVYGEIGGGSSERMNALNSVMQGAGFDAQSSDNIMQGMWEKWVQLAALGATTCLLRGNVGEIEAVPGGSEVALEILSECCAIAAGCGFAPRAAMLSQARAAIMTKGSKLTSSMYRDLSKGNRVEVDQILGDLLARGKAAGVSSPLLRAAFVNLSVYQARLATPRPAAAG